MNDNIDQNLIDFIKLLSNYIKHIYDTIYKYIDKLHTCKNLIILKNNENYDDFKFYNSIIDNTIYYFKNSTNIRLTKLSKDIKNLFKVIKLEDKINSEIIFNIELIENALEIYKNEFKDSNETNINKYYWMKDVTIRKYKNWLNDFLNVLYYHKINIESLFLSFSTQIKFFLIEKDSTILIDKNYINNYLNNNKVKILKDKNINNYFDNIMNTIKFNKNEFELFTINYDILKDNYLNLNSRIKFLENKCNYYSSKLKEYKFNTDLNLNDEFLNIDLSENLIDELNKNIIKEN
jgi:hypothetical protein